MKRSLTGRAISGVLMTAATAVPTITVVEMLLHVPHPVTPTLSAAVLSTATPAPAVTSASVPAAPAATARPMATAFPTVHTYTGTAIQTQYGVVQAVVTMTGKRITDVQISAQDNEPRSDEINSQAVPLLRSETLQAQSAVIDTVSGATFTSEGYIQSLQAALAQARGQA